METGLVQHRLDAKDIPADISEVYRYLGFSKPVVMNHLSEKNDVIPSETVELVKKCIFQMQKILHPQAIYQMFPLTEECLASVLQSKDLSKRLEGCSHVILLACTIGPQVDAMIRRWSKLDSATAVVMQACGAMFIESYLDIIAAQIEEQAKIEGFSIKPRYSPGYGDLPLEIQKLVFSVLPCTQKIALTLTDGLLMIPEKSVTAFIGVESLGKCEAQCNVESKR